MLHAGVPHFLNLMPRLLSLGEAAGPATQPTVDGVLGPHIYVFYVAFIIAFLFTPLMRAIALYYNIIDQPDKLRKMHSAPVAYLGGVAVFLGWTAGLAFSQVHLVSTDMATPHLPMKLSIVAGGCAIVLVGLWDDIRHIKPLTKIAGQVCAALLLLAQGVGSDCLSPILSPLGQRLGFPVDNAVFQGLVVALSCVTTVLVVVGCCNATNLMDGLDGLCGGVTAIIVGGFLVLAVHLGTTGLDPQWDTIRVVLALALLGGVLGFVPFNFNPASIFMGDTGSMFLGYACATIILLLARVQSRWFLASMVIFALPILDTSLAFARRFVNRRPLFSADRHHFHHQLVARGLSVRKTVVLSYGLSLAFAGLGIMIVFIRTRYAGAVYLVTFASIVVAAYKMGMVHEAARVVDRQTLESPGAALAAAVPDLEPGLVLDVRDGNGLANLSTAPPDATNRAGTIDSGRLASAPHAPPVAPTPS